MTALREAKRVLRPGGIVFAAAIVQIAARHSDPRTTTVYDHRRQSFDRHAAYVVVAFVTGG